MSIQPLVPLPPNCIEGKFLRRVKRFSIEFDWNGVRHWAHTNNSGAMLGLLRPGCAALFSPASTPGRKLPFTLERMRLPESMGGHWVGVNTLLPNRLLAAAFAAGELDFCQCYKHIKMEAKRGQSRIDARFDCAPRTASTRIASASSALYHTKDACANAPASSALDVSTKPSLWVECKNVTLVEDGCAAFPDAASQRAQKHLRELMDIVEHGERAAMFYLVQRPDAECFAPADYIDPAYAELFAEAREKGVEMHAYEAVLGENGTGLGMKLRM